MQYLKGLQIKSIRGFNSLELAFHSDNSPRLRTLIIGRNGTCKTSLLRSIVLGWVSEEDGISLLAEDNGPLLPSEKNRGLIGVTRIDTDSGANAYEETVISSTGTGEKLSRGERTTIGPEYPPTSESDLAEAAGTPPAVPFMCAFGVGRNPGGGTAPHRGYRLYDSVLYLFDYGKNLIDPELALRRLGDYTDKEKVETRLKRALDLSEDDSFHFPRGGGIHLKGPTVGKNSVPIQAWADGYRMTFSWLLDLYAQAMQAEAIDEEGEIGGILLIDEIEQHLHPSMQTGILDRISDMLPKMQIIATTHSPLTALACRPGELIVLCREGEQVVAHTDFPDFTGFSVEDLLTHRDFFNTPPYRQETNHKLEIYHGLVSIPPAQRSATQKAELAALTAELQRHQYIPPENETLLEEIRKMMA